MNYEDVLLLLKEPVLAKFDMGWVVMVRPTGRFVDFAPDNERPPRWRWQVEVREGWFGGKKWVPATNLKKVNDWKKS